MKISQELIVRSLCDPERYEELLGDLEEIRVRRACSLGKGRALIRYMGDLLSVCVFQSRFRRWTAGQWARACGIAWLMALGIISAASTLGSPSGPFVINARDAAGTFSLEMDRGRVLRATLNDVPLSADRMIQYDDRLIIRKGDGDRDLLIWITGEYSIRWEGRSPDPEGTGEDDARIET